LLPLSMLPSIRAERFGNLLVALAMLSRPFQVKERKHFQRTKAQETLLHPAPHFFSGNNLRITHTFERSGESSRPRLVGEWASSC